MTCYAILSDVHGQLSLLRRVLADARQRGAETIVSLGDISSDDCYDALREAQVQAAFGNYEASGWGDLSPENQQWVRSWPAVVVGDTFLAAHAAPYFPAPISNVDEVLDYLLNHQVKWKHLFPRLNVDQEACWLAWAALQERGRHIFFYGHTHVQHIWRIASANDGEHRGLQMIRQRRLILQDQDSYLVGVGSVGVPQDTPQPGYVLYDETTGIVELCRI